MICICLELKALASVWTLAGHRSQNTKWRRQSLSRGSVNLSKVYYPTKWAHVA